MAIRGSTPRRTQSSRTSKVSGKSVLELQDEKIEREAARYGEALPLALPEELVVDEFRDHKIKNLQKKEKRGDVTTDGEELHRVNHGWLDSDTLKYTKEGLGKKSQDVLVTTIRDWLKIHIFHLGTKHWVDLYNPAIKEDGWIVRTL